MNLTNEQDVWATQLLGREEYFDSVAVLGNEAKRVRFLGALLANVSEPLHTALFGDFQEGKTKEIILAQVTPSAFDCILRAAVHLDPGLTPHNVIQTLHAAQLYMITGLVAHCVGFVNRIKPIEALIVLSSVAAGGSATREDIRRDLWRKVLLNSKAVLESDAFAQTHGSIVYQLVKLEELEVEEETLWLCLRKWVRNAVSNCHLLGPFADILPEDAQSKRCKLDTSGRVSDTSSQEAAVLQALAKHVRIALLGKNFFCDEVMRFLLREDCESIMMFHMLGRLPPNFLTTPRSGFKPTEQILPINVTSSHNLTECEKLPSCTAAWHLSAVAPPEGRELRVKLPYKAGITRLEFTFAAGGQMFPRYSCSSKGAMNPFLRRQNGGKTESWTDCHGTSSNTGLVITLSLASVHESDEFRIEIKDVTNASQIAALKGLQAFGKKSQIALADDIANRLSSELSPENRAGQHEHPIP